MTKDVIQIIIIFLAYTVGFYSFIAIIFSIMRFLEKYNIINNPLEK